MKSVAWVLFLVVIAFGIYWIAAGAPYDWSWATEQQDGIPLWAIPISLLVIGLVLWYFDKMRAKFAVIVSAVICVIVVLELFEHNELDEGMRRPILYIVAIALLLALLQVKEDRLAIFFCLVTFGTLGISQFTDYQGLARWTASWSGSNAVVLNNGACTEKVRLATLSNTAQELNPNGGCYIRWKEGVRGQCVDAYDRWGRYIGNDCTGDINLDQKYAANFAASTYGNARVVSLIYLLCNKRGQTNIVTDGCP
ncbi:MAG TPA: hypothetical protein VIJ88_00330 [Candidatus Paceibacterota bacterium]